MGALIKIARNRGTIYHLSQKNIINWHKKYKN